METPDQIGLAGFKISDAEEEQKFKDWEKSLCKIGRQVFAKLGFGKRIKFHWQYAGGFRPGSTQVCNAVSLNWLIQLTQSLIQTSGINLHVSTFQTSPSAPGSCTEHRNLEELPRGWRPLAGESLAVPHTLSPPQASQALVPPHTEASRCTW